MGPKNNVLFADWVPKVESIKAAMPAIPIENNHSAGYYRTWVNNMIVRLFAEQILQSRKKVAR